MIIEIFVFRILFMKMCTPRILPCHSIQGLKPEEQVEYHNGSLSALLYADDTLLIGGAEKGLQRFLDSIAHVGANFGFQLHWGNFSLYASATILW